MKRGCHSFNIYFVLTCVLLAAGCSTSQETDKEKEHKKEQSTIRFFMETSRADATTAGTVQVTRAKYPYVVEREPFLSEADLAGAKIIDDPNTPGSYAMELQFNEHGTLVLEMYTASNIGRHIIVFAQFPKPGSKGAKPKRKPAQTNDDENLPPPAELPDPKKPRESAWLAAVLIRSRIPNGALVFTPDASRSEGLRIVRGLNNVIKKAKKKDL